MASRLAVGRRRLRPDSDWPLDHCSLSHAYSVLIITHWALRAPKKDTAHVIRSVMFVAVDNSHSTPSNSLTGPTAPQSPLCGWWPRERYAVQPLYLENYSTV